MFDDGTAIYARRREAAEAAAKQYNIATIAESEE
jgi:hypothetical protein